ncbi:hypothetical protein ACFW04_011544 [Cataglyphis niger]
MDGRPKRTITKSSHACKATTVIHRKPICLPISSVADIDTFETLDDTDYQEVVNYFKYIGGFNLKEAINLYLKEGLEESITPSFIW